MSFFKMSNFKYCTGILYVQAISITSKEEGCKDLHGSFYFIGKKLCQQNIRINQNISTKDIRLAPTHKPIIPPILEIRLVLFKWVDLDFKIGKV